MHDPNTTLIKLRQLGEAVAQDIAVSIVGHSRRAALGEALIPFEQRVRDAMRRIYALHAWTPSQRKWLDRLARQLTHEVVLDRALINHRFADHGGLKQLDALNDALWEAS
ncbi:type I restriction-modification enzyme R subunit C-terminal domain-containing protein [Halomonas sp. DQ26W]|uniref:type I restriction-modification enzyme R subunit C-terminal domain-containing protein n=1 Tax=Halomonas sp. DQ26W TaxID=2282311 RepID=UPI002163DE1C|nr:type I restriction-modification enzyme R subunit C-terminal domain-containing protein [Halomonas sp. DQ26W]